MRRESRFKEWLSGIRRRYDIMSDELFYLFDNCFEPVRQVFRFLARWFGTRHYLRLLWGFPAFVVLACVILSPVLFNTATGPATAIAYTRAAYQAVRGADLEAADLFMRKLAYLGKDDSSLRYSVALLAGEQGQLGKTIAIMEGLAKEDEQGYAPAHLWLARWYSRPGYLNEVERQERVQAHLFAAHDADPDNTVANFLLAQMLLSKNELKLARPYSEVVLASSNPVLQQQLAAFWGRSGDADESRRLLTAAESVLAKAYKGNAGDTSIAYPLVNVQTQLAKYRDAEDLLMAIRNSLSQPEDRKAWAANAGAFYAVLSVAILKQEPTNESLASSINLLERALKLSPSSPAVANSLQKFSQLEGDGGKLVEEMLEVMLGSGEVPAVVHLVLGTRRLARGEASLGQVHLEQAIAQNDKSGAILGNLAWALALQEEADLERAKNLVEGALERLPSEPELYETRGLIHLRQKKFQQAITDLERALIKIKGRPRLHSMLADAYRNVGNESLAKVHTDLASKSRSEEE